MDDKHVTDGDGKADAPASAPAKKAWNKPTMTTSDGIVMLWEVASGETVWHNHWETISTRQRRDRPARGGAEFGVPAEARGGTRAKLGFCPSGCRITLAVAVA